MSIFDVFDRISANSSAARGKIEYVITGLGNPGLEYENTRHNAGFMVLDELAKQLGEDINRLRFKGKTAEVTIEGKRCLLLKPTTFMNNSGEAVVQALEFYKIDAAKLIVVCDDISLDCGKLRIRRKGSHGGHNGLRNIEDLLETRNYARIRVGVGHNFSEGGQIDFVLGHFSLDELPELPLITKRVSDGVRTWALAGAQKAMTELNTKPETTENA